MRTNIVHIGAGELTYEIREIMQLVEKLSSMGMEITLETLETLWQRVKKSPIG